MFDTFNEDDIRVQTLALEVRIKCAMRNLKMKPMTYRSEVNPTLLIRAMRLKNGWKG